MKPVSMPGMFSKALSTVDTFSEEKTFTRKRLKARTCYWAFALCLAEPQATSAISSPPSPHHHQRHLLSWPQPLHTGGKQGQRGELGLQHPPQLFEGQNPLYLHLLCPPPHITAAIYPAKERLESHQGCTLIGLRGLPSSRRQPLPAGAKSACLRSTGMQLPDKYAMYYLCPD